MRLAIYVRSGLCNRLRVILSAIAYCERTGRELLIHWPTVDPAEVGHGGKFEATLSDLFGHPFQEITADEFEKCGRSTRLTDVQHTTKGDINLKTIHCFPGAKCKLDIPDRHLHDFLADRDVYTKPLADYWSVMRPSAEVQSRIDSVDVGDCLGVQIRAAVLADGRPNVNTEAPLEKFVARMRKWEGRFFLSVDNPAVERLLRAEFPERIVQLPQTYVYDRATILTRCAELYLLARCKRIVGSHISSFSEFAGWLAGSRYSACYLWPADEGDVFEDVALLEW